MLHKDGPREVLSLEQGLTILLFNVPLTEFQKSVYFKILSQKLDYFQFCTKVHIIQTDGHQFTV